MAPLTGPSLLGSTHDWTRHSRRINGHEFAELLIQLNRTDLNAEVAVEAIRKMASTRKGKRVLDTDPVREDTAHSMLSARRTTRT